MLKQIVVICAALGIASAALGLAELEPKPEKFKDVEGCYIKDLGAMIPFDKARPSTKSCMEYQCRREHVRFVTCGTVIVTPPRELEVHKDKPFPDCCPKLKMSIPQSPTAPESNNKL